MKGLEKLLIVDGYSVLSHIYYNLPADKNARGRHTSALRGLLHIVRQEVTEDTDGIYFTFGSNEQEKHFLYKTEDLRQMQIPHALEEQLKDSKLLLQTARIAVLEDAQKTGRQLIASLLQQCSREEIAVRLFTADEGLLAFLTDTVEVVIPQLQNGRLSWVAYDTKLFSEKYQITPGKWNFVQALSSKESPIGIGRGMALELAIKYADFDELYAHIEEIPSQRTRELLTQKRALLQAYYRALQTDEETDAIPDLDKAIGYQLSGEALETFLEERGVFTETASLAENKASKTNKSRVSWSYKLEKMQNIAQADTIWNACMEDGVTALQMFTISGQKDTQLLSSATGQMFLQLGEEEATDILCVALAHTKYPNTVFWMSSEENLSTAYLQEKVSTFLRKGKSLFATFDVKSQYGQMLMPGECITLKETERIFDTKIAAYLLNPLNSDYQIQDVASEYLQLQMDAWKDIFGKADTKSAYLEQKEQMTAYYANMVWIIFHAYDILEHRLLSEGMKFLFREVEMPLTYVLYDMEQEGIRIKPEALKQYGDSLLDRIGELEEIIYREAGTRFNINSPKQLGEVLFEKLGLPGGKKTKTGYSTAADVLEKLSEEYPIVNDILEYRQLAKLKSTYADGLANYIEADGRIHTNFNQTITATGRLSSTEPNLQNIPMRMELGRLIRKVFVPKEGCIFMDADYSQIELRILAHMSEDQNLIDAYQMSEDIHRITASQVFHTPFEEVTDLQRRNAKAVNFGIVYGISSFGLSQGLSITRQEAAGYIERYFETYPGVKNFLDRLVSDAKLSGKSKSMFGRIRPIPELQASHYVQRQFGERVAMNAPIQGTAADIIKIAMVKVWQGLQEAGLQSKLILQIHDELLIETWEQEKEQVQEIMTRQMQEAAHLSVALEVDLHTGMDWYEAK